MFFETRVKIVFIKRKITEFAYTFKKNYLIHFSTCTYISMCKCKKKI